MDSKGGLYTEAGGASADMMRSTEEDALVDGPLISPDALHSAIRREFQTVPTSWQAVLLSLLHSVFFVLSVCVAVLCVLKFGKAEACASILGPVSGDSAILFAKVCLWAVVALFSRSVQHHHGRARSRGYLQFYRQTQRLQHVPLTINSGGNVMLLVVQAAGLPPTLHTALLLSILGLELSVTVVCLLYYAVKVRRFNSSRAAPDVCQEERSHTFSLTNMPTETGFREGSSLEDVVEKQADLIEYLKQHNSVLSKRLLNLTAQH